MSKLLKLKNKPFWLVSALVFVFAAAYYQQTRKEGFEDAMRKVVGMKVSVNLAKIPQDILNSFFTANTSFLIKLVDASDGSVLWKDGDIIPTKLTDTIKPYIFVMRVDPIRALNTDPSTWSLSKIETSEKEIVDRSSTMPLQWHKDASYKITNLVIETSDGKYVDKNGASLIGSTKIGDYNVNKTLLWVIGAVVGLSILFIVFKAFSSKSAISTVPNVNRTANTSSNQVE